MGRKEDMAKLASTLMEDREYIRNIGVVAHIDHGKCISKDSKIALANGEFIEAQSLFEKLKLKGKKARHNKNETVFDVKKASQKVFSFNKETLSFELKPITHVWKLKGKNLIELTLSTGRKIKTTPEHKYLLLSEQGKVMEKEASKITEEDFILAPNSLNFIPLNLEQLKNEILQKIALDNNFYVMLEEKKGIELKRKVMDFGLEKTRKKVDSKLKNKSFYHGVYKNRYRIQDFVKVAELFKLKNPYNLIKFLNYRKGLKKEGHSSVYLKLPQTSYEFTELMYLLGVIWGDGGISGKEIRITNKSKEMHQSIKHIVKLVFNQQAKVRDYNERTPRIDLCLGITFAKFLTAAFDLPCKDKARQISIPSLADRMPLEFIKAFIQGYFDSDGTIETSRRAASISSVSKKMIQDLQLTLLKFSCIATFNEKKNALYLSASNMKTFYENINFRLSSKQERLRKIVEKSDSANRNTDLLPITSTVLKSLREKIGISQSKFNSSYGPMERNQIPVYIPNLSHAISVFYNFVGNPKIKDKKAWDELQMLEQIVKDCFCVQVKEIKEIKNNDFVYDFSVEKNKNFIAEGIVIHNTTMTDNLIAAAGLMSEELAGKQLVMDSEDQEAERGITINSANISVVTDIRGKKYLINIIDTPGHVDFTGEVIRAMRACDGVIVVVCASEGPMPQTETVVRQALKEKVKPILFINKVDRLINELQVTQEDMQKRFVKIITQVNNLIQKSAPEEFKGKWLVKPENGSVCFGSAYHNWAVSVPFMKKTGINFKKVYDFCKNEDQKTLAKQSPLHECLFEAVIDHLPTPIMAQPYRIPAIWTGEQESEIGKNMLACGKEDPFSMMVTDVSVDAHAGDIATGRVYSGAVEKGKKLKLIGGKKDVQIQKVGIYMGPDFVEVPRVPAGNIVSIVGLKEVYAGETVSTVDMQEFESFMSNAEPVMTISIEAKQTKDLPKLITVIRQLTKEDPNLRASINQETGEHLLAGMGELHLEVNQYRIESHHKIPVNVSHPIVVYHETVTKNSPVVEGKSPNKHNKFKMLVRKIPVDKLANLIESRIDGKIKPKDKPSIEKFENMGFEKDYAKKIWAVHNQNILADMTRGIQSLHEIRELVIQGFNDAMDQGPLAKEKCFGLIVELHDATLHEDAIHRGPAQVLPAITRTIYACMLSADAVIYEPKQMLTITAPESYMGAISKELGARRIQIQVMDTEGDTTKVVGKAPVKELIGFSQDMRSATQGRAQWVAEYVGYELLPREMQHDVIKEIRTRKGMDPEPKQASFFMD